MVLFLLRRAGGMILALFFVVSLTFFVMKVIPGGPFDHEKKLPASIEKNISEKYHLDDPLYIQYQDYLMQAVRFDFGPSFKYQNRSVNEIILESFPVSALVGGVAMIIALTLGVLLGLIATLNQNRLGDYLAMSFATLGFSLPSFVVAYGLMYFFSYQLGWLPPAMWGSWRHLLMPALALSFLPMAGIARLTRSSLIDVLQQEYIRTARGKGLKKSSIIYRYALRNAALPVISYIGPVAAGIFTGSFIIEYIFNIPGLGRYFVTSIQNRDYTLIMGTTIFYSVFLMIINLLVDLIYVFVDPRVKLYQEKRSV